MPRSLRIAYFAHAISSDWNNGNAHFLRGLLRGLVTDGHQVIAWEPSDGWSVENLLTEPNGDAALRQFRGVYPDLDVHSYVGSLAADPEADGRTDELWLPHLRSLDIVILHEWNPPELAQRLLRLRARCGYKLLFHDTHHRASSSPESFGSFGLAQFDGTLAFGEALRRIYLDRFGLKNVWTLHEAADTTVFHPMHEIERTASLVWVGNWGEGERSAELRQFLIEPASELRYLAATTVYGVRYPGDGRIALAEAGIGYGGYLPNLSAPALYAGAAATVHVPRQQYSTAMHGIPTIRVFEALACGIPLVSAPWQDSEALFRPGDLTWASTTAEMTAQLRGLLAQPLLAQDRALAGMETILTRHTCHHRAQELEAICEEVLAA